MPAQLGDAWHDQMAIVPNTVLHPCEVMPGPLPRDMLREYIRLYAITLERLVSSLPALVPASRVD